MIKHIATQAVYVEDQAKAKEFWTRKAGFEVRAEHPMGPNAVWLEVAPPGAQSALVLYPKAGMPGHAERKPSIVFACEAVEETCEGMRARGVRIVEEPKRMPWGTYATFADEDGNEFLLKG